MFEAGGTSSEVTVLGAMWRRRRLVALCFVLGGALLYLVGQMLPGSGVHSALAAVVVRESVELSIGSTDRPERFVANQIQVLRSRRVAQRTIELVAEAGLGEVTREEIERRLSVIGQEGSDQIVIRYVADDPELAITVANSVLEAYQELNAAQANADAQDAVDRIDAEIEVLDERLDELEGEIREIEDGDETLQELAAQADAALAQIETFQQQFDSTNNLEARQAIGFALNEMRSRVQFYLTARSSLLNARELATLIELQSRIAERRAQLVESRDQVLVDAATNPGVIAFADPAEFATFEPGFSGVRALAAGLMLGLVVGGALATALENKQERVIRRGEIGSILDAPLLASVPDFSQEGLSTRMPVFDAPRSASAEAFRFAVTSLETVTRGMQSPLVLITSPGTGQGKTVTTANLGLAAAMAGYRVLLIDADFGSQHLTKMLLPDRGGNGPGLTDALSGDVLFDEATQRVPTSEATRLYLMTRGSPVAVPSEVFQSSAARDLAIAAKLRFDFILIDAPPLLRVAYTSSLLQLSDTAIAVIPRGLRAEDLTDLRDRLEFIDRPLAGYLFTKDALDEDWRGGSLSMQGVFLGADEGGSEVSRQQ